MKPVRSHEGTELFVSKNPDCNGCFFLREADGIKYCGESNAGRSCAHYLRPVIFVTKEQYLFRSMTLGAEHEV